MVETASSINCQDFLVPVSSLVLTVFSRYEEQSLYSEQELLDRNVKETLNSCLSSLFVSRLKHSGPLFLKRNMYEKLRRTLQSQFSSLLVDVLFRRQQQVSVGFVARANFTGYTF